METERGLSGLKPGDVIKSAVDLRNNEYVGSGTFRMIVADKPDEAHGMFGKTPFKLMPIEKTSLPKGES